MDIEKVEQGDKTILYVSGRIDTQTSKEFQDMLDEIIDEESVNIVLDFNDVEYVSSAGLRAILYAQKKINNIENSKMILRNVKDEVMEVFEMTGFTEFLLFEKN